MPLHILICPVHQREARRHHDDRPDQREEDRDDSRDPEVADDREGGEDQRREPEEGREAGYSDRGPDLLDTLLDRIIDIPGRSTAWTRAGDSLNATWPLRRWSGGHGPRSSGPEQPMSSPQKTGQCTSKGDDLLFLGPSTSTYEATLQFVEEDAPLNLVGILIERGQQQH